MRRLALWTLVPLTITFLAWHALPLQPQPGEEYSWVAALHMAAHDGISFGNHLVFTYGPLGYLSIPVLWYTGTGVAAVLYAVLVRIALAAALFAGARRTYGTFLATIVALVVASASAVAVETVPFLVLAVWVVDRVVDRGQLLVLMSVAGALAGFELLNRESIGIEVAALAAVMALAASGRRRDHIAMMLGALVLTVLAAWTTTGQDWGALPAYAGNTIQIVSGYAAALGGEEAGLGWQYAAALVALVFGLAGALHLTSNADARRRWGVVSLWLTFCFFEYKEGFVRHDAGHGAGFFIALMGGFLAFGWRPGRRVLGFGLGATLFAFTLAAENQSFSDVFQPGDSAKSGIDQLGAVLSGSERDATIARGRAAIKSAFPIDERTLNLIKPHTVHIAPYEVAVAWAYRLHWRPLPLFQSYAAYTTRLDRQDANAINSPRAPQRILANLDPEPDARPSVFDEGLTTLAILCRYQELRATASWLVLALGADRCQAATRIGTVHAGWGQSVPIPRPPDDHSFVLARIQGTGVEGIERLTALLYKPSERTVILDGGHYRFVEGTAPDGLLLRAPAGVDFSPPFNFARNSSTIAVGKVGQGHGGGRPITFSFFTEAVSAGPRHAS